MLVFEINKLFHEIIDLRTLDRFKCSQVVVRIFVFLVFILLAFSSLLNFSLNFDDDIRQAWPSLTPFFGYCAYILVYWHLLKNRADFYFFFEDIQMIVVESTYI